MGVNDNKAVSSMETRADAQGTLGVDLRQAPKPSMVTRLDRWLVRKILASVGEQPFAFRLWDGTLIKNAGSEPRFLVTIQDRRALLMTLIDPELNFGDLYSAGRIDVEGRLAEFLGRCYQGMRQCKPNSTLSTLLNCFQTILRRNSLMGSRRNIHHHYDISNEFYQLWLDRIAQQYTCAYFPDPEMTLEQAQEAKLHHVCRKLQLKPGDRVIEAGCGWGGLARFMAKNYGVSVRAYNISHEQIVFAREKAEAEGLAEHVMYVEDDYRNITGSCDVFVSVGMLEHVGTRYFGELGSVIQRCLKPDGRGLIHTIGRIQPGLMNAWIQKRIFPGAHIPSLGEMMDIFEPNQFAVQDVENLRLHYVKTLQHWLHRFDENAEMSLENRKGTRAP